MTDDIQSAGSQPEPEDDHRVELRRWVIPAGLVVLVVALVAVALYRGPTTFDPTTPEGAVQEYLQAVADGRWEDAFAVLDPEAFADCEPSDMMIGVTEPFTATHEGTTYVGDRAGVEVKLRFGDPGGIGSGWETWERFELIESDGFWYITGDPWPYFRWSCERL
jgi:hypothetical protein